jgi:penicillin amidase
VFDIVQRLVENRRRARRPETLQLGGLNGSVEVITDVWGVPHIYAESTDDLFFAQGFVTARDRLFQMDYNRHAAAGRLCELVGRRPLPWQDLTVHLKEKTTYDVDVMLRTFGMERAARASYDVHSEAAHAALRAYAAGINAYISTGAGTLEHRILGVRPEPWTEVDSLIMFKAIGFELNFAWRAVLLGGMLRRAGVPEDLQRVLWPHYPADGPSIVDSEAWQKAVPDLAAARVAADAAVGIGNAPGVGSNGFAVAGSHSKDGDALLANDTHLILLAPQPWHEVRLYGGDLDLHGYALAGVPGVAIGRTPEFAWGITAGLVHDLDLFAEKLHPTDSKKYLTPDGYQTLFEREEAFEIRGESTVRRTIYESRHGPLLETVATEPDEGTRFAVCWTGHRPSRELDGLMELWRATSFQEARNAVRHIVCPTYSITYAGADGSIGYMLAGALPKRRAGTPLRPLEGWTGEWDWDGVVPAEHNPWLENPSCGFVVNANNRVCAPDYPYELGNLFEPPERFERITERLTALGETITREDLAALQVDNLSAWGRRTRDRLLELAGGVGGLASNAQSIEREAAELWLNWDGYAHRDSAGAAVGLQTARDVSREVVRRLAGADAAFAFAELGDFIGQPTIELPDIAPRLAELGIDLAQVVRESFERSVQRCQKELGNTPSDWKWGALHPMLCRHRMDATPLGRFFSIGPEPADGGPDTVNRGDMSAKDTVVTLGPAMRMVVSARDRDQAGTIMPGGNSGDRLSSHYDDQLSEFLAGRLKPAPVSRDRVSVAFRETLAPESS